MPRCLRFGAFIALVLSSLFFSFFQITKHNSVLGPVNPFAEDPYDAVGSFGIQAAGCLAFLSLLRAFTPFAVNGSSEDSRVLLARTEMLAILAVGITLTADTIAMLRYRSLWAGSSGGPVLAALLGAMIVLAALSGIFIHRSTRNFAPRGDIRQFVKAALVCMMMAFLLALYPEHLRRITAGELFTVIVGATLLFLPMRILGLALVPCHPQAHRHNAVTSSSLRLPRYHWALVLLAGAIVGLLYGLRELGVPNEVPHLTPQFLFVTGVYTGLQSAAVLIGYILLRKPLGLVFGIGSQPRSISQTAPTAPPHPPR